MPFEDASSHLQDILDSIHSIEQFVHGMDREAYCRDEKTQAAVGESCSSSARRLSG